MYHPVNERVRVGVQLAANWNGIGREILFAISEAYVEGRIPKDQSSSINLIREMKP